MASETPSSNESSRDVESRHIQHEVSNLLRDAAQHDVSRMPQDVSDRIRGLMASEFGTTFTESKTDEGTREEPPLIVALPVRQRVEAATRHQTKTAPPSEGATVHSFEAAKTRREGRRRNVWAASAAAAAAVLAGGVGIGVMNEQGVSAAGKGTSSTHTSRASLNASDIRITDTGTKYIAKILPKQISQNDASSVSVSPSAAAAPMGSKQGVTSCISGLKSADNEAPKSAHADFGTYEGKSSVVVTLDFGNKKVVWVVSPNCGQGASNVLAGPITLKP